MPSRHMPQLNRVSKVSIKKNKEEGKTPTFIATLGKSSTEKLVS